MHRVIDLRSLSAALLPLVRWTVLAAPVAVLAGSASAFFLKALDWVTQARFQTPGLLFLLPLGGCAVGWIYARFGSTSDKGNNLILEEIHRPGGGVPLRMAPFVLFGTLVTHLFGGSAGREGTAVQMGGSLASGWARLWRVDPENQRILLLAGVAAGFASVFGTPLAGAVFAMEVVVIGRLRYDALIPVMIAAVLGDMTCTAWGVHHSVYHVSSDPASVSLGAKTMLVGKVVVAAVGFGLVSALFSHATHGVQALLRERIHVPHLRPVAGGIVVIALTFVVGTRDYLGLGVEPGPGGVASIATAFQPGGVFFWSWLWKLIFTAVTVGSGFKGGEVTPLFFIGAALGNVVGMVLGGPVDLFAALGFLAVFGAAANTPLACTVMGVELFGGEYALLFGIANFVAYHASGHSGIYLSQRVGAPKRELHPELQGTEPTLREVARTSTARPPKEPEPPTQP